MGVGWGKGRRAKDDASKGADTQNARIIQIDKFINHFKAMSTL
jgi:hypothetical protein